MATTKTTSSLASDYKKKRRKEERERTWIRRRQVIGFQYLHSDFLERRNCAPGRVKVTWGHRRLPQGKHRPEINQAFSVRARAQEQPASWCPASARPG